MEQHSNAGICVTPFQFACLSTLFLTLIFMAVAAACVCAETDPKNGHPEWHERGLLVLTNACRMDPPKFRDTYIGSYNILLPANYPPAPPIYWNYDLNVCARNHSVDMANNCGMSHNSCDGTKWDTRIKKCYNFKSPKIGENVATGYEMPQTTLKQWITDGNPPPADKTTDGHRKNIMSKDFKEMGAGYAYGPKQYRHFWTQDLGGGAPTVTNNIVIGSHFFFAKGTTSFMVVYYDASGQAPASARLVLENTPHDLTLHLGTQAKGAYRIDFAEGSACRHYYYEFIDDSQKKWRYPEAGYLVTYGEGQCDKHYAIATLYRSAGDIERKAPFRIASSNLVLLNDREGAVREFIIVRINGQTLRRVLPETGGSAISVPLKSLASGGVYTIAARYDDGTIKKMRLMIAE